MSVVVNGFVTRAPGNSKYLSSSSSVLYAGFGGGGEASNNKSNNKKKKKKINKTDTNKMKPKVQWDRYLEFKYEPKIAVAVQIITDADADADTDAAAAGSGGSGEWLNVGCVKSKDSNYTSQAVFRQRGIIAEHAKRLHPIQLATNGKQQVNLRWAYYDFSTSEKKDEDENDDTEEEGQWMIVDKSTISGTDEVGLEKLIGFMGRPDPVTGFYCQYEGGRITSNPLSSNGQEGGKSGGSGGPVTGSNKKGPGDGVI